VPRSCFLHRAGFDLYDVAHYILAHILWLQGYPDQAMEAIQACIAEARLLQNPVSLCSVLAFGGCSLCLRTGDLDAAERLAGELVSYAQRYALADFLAYGQAVQEIVSLRKAGAKAREEQFRVALQHWRASGWHILLGSSDLAQTVANAEYTDEILAILNDELERAERDQVLSTFPETLRIKGDLLLLRYDPNGPVANACFLGSLDLARARGAPGTEANSPFRALLRSLGK
jgi:hypothetical protein